MKTIVLLTGLLCAGLIQAEDLMVHNQWIRPMPPVSEVTAGFMDIMNASDKDVRLVSVKSMISDNIELHEHIHDEGVMRMREVEGGIVIPAKSTQSFKPGGYHIMFLDLNSVPKKGEKVSVQLSFSDGTVIEIHYPVEDKAVDHSDDGKHHHH